MHRPSSESLISAKITLIVQLITSPRRIGSSPNSIATFEGRRRRRRRTTRDRKNCLPTTLVLGVAELRGIKRTWDLGSRFCWFCRIRQQNRDLVFVAFFAHARSKNGIATIAINNDGCLKSRKLLHLIANRRQYFDSEQKDGRKFCRICGYKGEFITASANLGSYFSRPRKRPSVVEASGVARIWKYIGWAHGVWRTDIPRGGSSLKILGAALRHQPFHHRLHFLRSPKPKNTIFI